MTDKGGPAMTWSMHSISHLELKDRQNGNKFFQKNFEFITNEFQVRYFISFSFRNPLNINYFISQIGLVGNYLWRIRFCCKLFNR